MTKLRRRGSLGLRLEHHLTQERALGGGVEIRRGRDTDKLGKIRPVSQSDTLPPGGEGGVQNLA